MKVTFIGGGLHGQEGDLRDGTKSFLASVPAGSAYDGVKSGADTVEPSPTEMYVKTMWRDRTGDEVLMALHTLSVTEVDALARPLMAAKRWP